ncbi:hypothetical protein PR002_g3825 [Phytophthora rubi]|uniref:Chromo domain-containing protein n=1 Tax=Phytophthora rubi TaxID=129364 RepID=A0A6A3NE57_9STRA|nr:hypothetical protein PR002_g3825 [Phytophthora rubi]
MSHRGTVPLVHWAHLLTGDEFEVHGSRLKHYCDSDLGATAEIREHVASQGIVLGVRAIVDHRFEPTAQEWQLLVAWRGLEDMENAWEPFASICGDVPALVAQAPSPDDTAAQATADLAADAGATSNAGANANLGNELRGKSPQPMTKRGACLGGSEAGDSDGSGREARSGSQEWLPA